MRVDILFDSLATETHHFKDRIEAETFAYLMVNEDGVYEVQIDGERVPN